MPISTRKPVAISIDGVLQSNVHLLTVEGNNDQIDSHVATFAYQHQIHDKREGIVQKKLQGKSLPEAFEYKLCEVFIDNKLVHFGYVNGGKWIEDENGEALIYTSRLNKHLFGQIPIGSGFYHWAKNSTIAGRRTYQWGDVVFNPIHDGKIQPNMDVGVFDGSPGPIFIHPDEPSNAAPPAFLWKLADAVYYVLHKTTNHNSPANLAIVPLPTFAEIQQVIDPLELHDFRIPGDMLPIEALSALLEPHGYGWTVAGELFTGKKFVFYKRGRPKAITIGRDETKAKSISVDHTDKTADTVEVIGGRLVREGTFELIPAWDPKYDTLGENESYNDFTIGSDRWKNEPEIRRVFRDYVLNETGEYTHLRPANSQFVIGVFIDDDGFDSTIPLGSETYRPHRFGACLSLGPDGAPIGQIRGCHVQYKDEEDEWQDLNEGIEILKKECGIRLTSATLPFHLMKVMTIRITASITGDSRLYNWQDNVHSHLYPATKYHRVFAGEKYKYQQREWSGDNASIYANTNPPTPFNFANDSSALNQLASELLQRFDHPTVAGTVDLHGVDHDPLSLLGKGVDTIAGVSLKARDGSYPEIVGFSIDVQEQTTTLTLGRAYR